MSFLNAVWRRAERVVPVSYVDDRALRDVAMGEIDLDRRGSLFLHDMRTFYRRLDAYNQAAVKPCKLSVLLSPEFESCVLGIARKSYRDEPRLVHNAAGMALKIGQEHTLPMSWCFDRTSLFSVQAPKGKVASWNITQSSGNTAFGRFAETVTKQVHAMPLAVTLGKQRHAPVP